MASNVQQTPPWLMRRVVVLLPCKMQTWLKRMKGHDGRIQPFRVEAKRKDSCIWWIAHGKVMWSWQSLLNLALMAKLPSSDWSYVIMPNHGRMPIWKWMTTKNDLGDVQTVDTIRVLHDAVCRRSMNKATYFVSKPCIICARAHRIPTCGGYYKRILGMHKL